MTVDYYTLCVVDSALKYHGVHCVQYDRPQLKRKAEEGGSAVQYSHLQWGGSTQCTIIAIEESTVQCTKVQYNKGIELQNSSVKRRNWLFSLITAPLLQCMK